MNYLHLLFLLLNFGMLAQSGVSESLNVGDVAYDFVGVDEKGNKIKISEYRERKFVLLNFSHTLCAPCWSAYERLNKIHSEYFDKLTVITLHVDDRKEKWNKISKSKGINLEFKSIWKINSEKQKVNEIYGVNGFPYFVLIDKKGEIKKKWLGGNEKKLKRIINRFL